MTEFVTDIDRVRWEELVRTSPVATWFQTPACADFFAALECLKGFEFGIAEDGVLKGVVVGYMTVERNPLKQMMTRRAVINGGPLLAEDISDGALKALLDGISAALRDVIYFETRNFNDYSRWRPVFESCGWEYEPHLNIRIGTSDLPDPFEIIGRHRRRYIRMSLRNGSTIVADPTLDEVKQYYTILTDLYSTKVKTPLFPWEFFESLYREEDSRFLLVSKDGRITGGAVCVCLAGRGVYEWFACGLDGKEKDCYPSSVATYAGIRHATDNCYPVFDFMGAGKPGEHYGVRDFKAEFGGTLVEHGRFKHINSPLLYRIGELGVKILKRL